MKTWLKSLPDSFPDEIASPMDAAEYELRSALKDVAVHLKYQPDMGEGWKISKKKEGEYEISGGNCGVLYGSYELIRRKYSREAIPDVLESSPRYSFRMINCWDNMDGTVERGYAGRSLFYENGEFHYEPQRIRELARMMASVGLNTICINNVNVHYPAQLLLEDKLGDLSEIAALFRPFGVRLMISIDFSQPLRHGLKSADPLDPAVQEWWNETADRVYRCIPDLAGFLVKADSEGRPGPFTYNRNHAEGANLLARALKPHGGILVWRCFVYNCLQDWRDMSVDRPKAAYEHYAWLDGQFDDNVILQVKNGPFDFQVREPISPLLLAMKKTNLALELQLAQEYTGQQIDIYNMLPMWKEIMEDLPEENIMSMAAVSNFGRDENYTGHPFAAANLFGYGLFSWDPKREIQEILLQWIRLTYDLKEEDQKKILSLLLKSREIYEKYTAPLGLNWMVTPHTHYGPNPSGYEYDLWGTYHKADRNAVGIDRTDKGTGYLEQYPPELRKRYEDPAVCPDRLKLFFHRLPYTYRMQDGRTLIQRIYDDHFEGAEETAEMAKAIRGIAFPEPDRSVILERMERQLHNAKEWCDVINTFFHRLSGIDDGKSRKIWP